MNMNTFQLLLKILVMAAVTYLIRMIPIAFVQKKIRNPFVLSFLYYIPYAVLAAMTFPAILSSTGNLLSAIAGLAAGAFLALKGKGLLTVALASCAGALAVEIILRLLG